MKHIQKILEILLLFALGFILIKCESNSIIAQETSIEQLNPLQKSYDYCVIKVQERNNDHWKLRKTKAIVFINNTKCEEEFNSIEDALQFVGDKGYELRGCTFYPSINKWYIYHTLYFIK